MAAVERTSRAFDGGYGLLHNGRWNSQGRPVTYCSTVPSLAALEKRVHVADASLLPPQVLVVYEAPNDVAPEHIAMGDLPPDWTRHEAHTQRLGDAWLDAARGPLLLVPSVVIPVASAPERNVLINHRHAGSRRIAIVDVIAFTLDVRLFGP